MPYSEADSAQHLRDVSIHEIGHAFAALSRSDAVMVELKLDQLYHLPHHKIWDGRVHVRVLDNDKFLDSVYGWSGIMGEAIDQNADNAVDLALERYRNQRQTVSDTDLVQIECVPEEIQLRSSRAAYESLLEKWGEIKDIQSRVIKLIEGRKLDALGFGWMKADGWMGLE